MTDNERLQRAYAQVQQKHPNVTDRTELDRLAIAQEKKNLRLHALLWLGGALVSGILYVVILLFASDTIKSANYILLCTAVSCIVEMIINLRKAGMVQQQFQPTLEIQHSGIVTMKMLKKDCGRKLAKANGQFQLEICALLDKEDEQDMTVDNLTTHSYYLHFANPNGSCTRKFKVRSKEYRQAVIGSEYYVVSIAAPVNQIATVYSSASWQLAPDLEQLAVRSTASEQCNAPQQTNAYVYEQPIVPNPVQTVIKTPEKTKVLLPILAMACAAAGLLMPVILALPVSAGGIVMSAIAKKRQNSSLAKASFIVSILLVALVALITVLAFVMDI